MAVEKIASYLELGFDVFGLNQIVQNSFSSANQNDAFFELSEASIGNNKLKNLTVTDAKIQSLSADKITAGTLAAVTNVGDESIQLDGENKTIKIFDDSSPAKVSIYMKGGSA